MRRWEEARCVCEVCVVCVQKRTAVVKTTQEQ